MRIAVIGRTGQLARALISRSPNHGVDLQSYGRDALDLGKKLDHIDAFIENLDTDAVIIAAAYTDVDKAETELERAYAVNANAPAAIAKACARRNIPLVHISTDYVFSGEAATPYQISASTGPINSYGRSKLAGEEAVLAAHKTAAIIRTSWVFDGTGQNFMTTMLRLAQSRDQLSIVSDQIGRPTYAGHLAESCFIIARALKDSGEAFGGLYHVSGSGEAISWADFARAIFAAAKSVLPRTIRITPIPSSDYPTPAPRPAYSVLDLSRYENTLGALPGWRDGLEEAYKEWAENQ